MHFFNGELESYDDNLINGDVFRKLLGGALREYNHVRCKIEHPINLEVPGWPSHAPVPHCAACHRAGADVPLCQVHTDAGFHHCRLASAVLAGG